MAFPVAGGRYQRPSFGGGPESAVIRSPMESGPPKQTKIKSRVLEQRDIAIRWSATDFAAFETWFDGSECNRGASFFDWDDPKDGTTKQARIVDGAYDWDTASAGEGATIDFVVSMTLEVWV